MNLRGRGLELLRWDTLRRLLVCRHLGSSSSWSSQSLFQEPLSSAPPHPMAWTSVGSLSPSCLQPQGATHLAGLSSSLLPLSWRRCKSLSQVGCHGYHLGSSFLSYQVIIHGFVALDWSWHGSCSVPVKCLALAWRWAPETQEWSVARTWEHHREQAGCINGSAWGSQC